MLNVSENYLSIIINSDSFQAEYRRRRDEYNIHLADGVQTQLHHTALKALMKLDQCLDEDDLDARFVLDAADKMTQRMGFGPSAGDKPQMVVNNSVVVNRDTLAQAREIMAQRVPAAESQAAQREEEPCAALPKPEEA